MHLRRTRWKHFRVVARESRPFCIHVSVRILAGAYIAETFSSQDGGCVFPNQKTSQLSRNFLDQVQQSPRKMSAESKLSLHQYLPPQDSSPLLETVPSQQLPSSAPRSSAPAATTVRPPQRDARTRPRMSVLEAYALHAPKKDPEPDSDAPSRRPSTHVSSPAQRSPAPASTNIRPPQRNAATKARMRVLDAYALHAPKQDSEFDSEAPSRRPSTRQPTPTYSDDSSDSDIFVDDSESDCPRRIKAGSGKKRKRSASPVMGEEERRNRKALKLSGARDRRPKEEASGFMVRSGCMMRNIIQDTARRATRMPPRSRWKKGRVSGRQNLVRRAGLNDMGPSAESYMSEWDEVRVGAPR